MMADIIIKQGARILFPSDYQKLWDQMPEYYQRICDAMLLSGMRPIEFERYDPSWYRGSRRVIVLPEGACKKDKCEFKARTITLSLAGCDAFDKLTPEILKKRPHRVAFRDAMRRYATLAGIGTDGISPKMFRKTLVSWLVACYPEKSLYIQASMGHNQDTIVNNYLGLGFTREQIESMRTKYLNEWGTLV